MAGAVAGGVNVNAVAALSLADPHTSDAMRSDRYRQSGGAGGTPRTRPAGLLLLALKVEVPRLAIVAS